MNILRSVIARRQPQQAVNLLAVNPTPALAENSLTRLVQQQDGLPEDRGVRGDQNFIHLSSLLHDFCPRKRLLMERDEASGLWNPRSADRVLWEMGRAAERYCREQIIKSLNYSGVVGTWVCPCETTKYTGYYNPRVICNQCRLPCKDYDEVQLYDHQAGVVGRPDMLVEFGGRLTVVEFKSKSAKLFNDLREPEVDHVLQGLSYRRKLLNVATNPERVNDSIVVFYVAKDYTFRGSIYKEYHVRFDNQQYQPGLTVLRQQAMLTKQHREAGTLPPRLTQCTVPTSTTARNCSACSACFNRRD